MQFNILDLFDHYAVFWFPLSTGGQRDGTGGGGGGLRNGRWGDKSSFNPTTSRGGGGGGRKCFSHVERG